MSIDHGSWTVERTYPHPPARVFQAWADSRVKVRWFDLSDAENPDYTSDFRVGGRETYRTRASGPTVTYDGEYRDIVEPERIVTTYEMTTDERRLSVSLVTVQLFATTTGTRLVYTEQGAYLDGPDGPGSRRGGASTQLDRLAEVLRSGW